MKIAVIADVHGNYPALEAVLDDARANGAEAYLLLGDYIRDTLFLNDVGDAIRGLPNCTAILGNGDIGVISLDDTKPDHCEFEQMLPNFWTYKNLSKENLDFLKSLPKTAEVVTPCGKLLHLSHSIPLISHTPRLGAFHSGDYSQKMEAKPFSFEDGIAEMQSAAEEYAFEVAEYPGDVCLFGHNHLQFCGSVSGKILLNPGSLGMPCDYDTRAPYALICDDGKGLKIELRRVEYDVNKTINAVREFDAFRHAEFWGRLHVAMLESASDIVMNRFWKHARSIGGGKFPMENELWNKAVESYVIPKATARKGKHD
jgi:predicted phosphodiesterase